MSYLKKYRHDMFPEIEDFYNPQDELRKKSPNDMDFGDYLWFSPFCAKIIILSFFGFWYFVSLSLLTSSILTGGIIRGILGGVIGFITAAPSVKYTRLYMKTDRNMYDLFLRDYHEGGIEDD